MGLGIFSLLLALGALLGAIGGFLLTPLPFVGAALSIAAPLLAVAASVTGAVAMQRAKRVGESGTMGLVGLVAGVLVFCPSTLVALTCGMCNAMFSTQGELRQTDGGIRFQFHKRWSTPLDGGAAPEPIVPTPQPPPPGAWAEPHDAATEKPTPDDPSTPRSPTPAPSP